MPCRKFLHDFPDGRRAVGPGLGQSEGTLAVSGGAGKAECPVVVDADGINVLSAHRDLLRGRKSPTILTPHDGEFARLGGVIGEDRMAAAAALAEELGCVVLLKGHETCITDGTDGYLPSRYMCRRKRFSQLCCRKSLWIKPKSQPIMKPNHGQSGKMGLLK